MAVVEIVIDVMMNVLVWTRGVGGGGLWTQCWKLW